MNKSRKARRLLRKLERAGITNITAETLTTDDRIGVKIIYTIPGGLVFSLQCTVKQGGGTYEAQYTRALEAVLQRVTVES